MQPADFYTGLVADLFADDGALLRFSVRSEERDEPSRTQRSHLRYERLAGGEHTVLDRTWTLHWHDQEGFRALAAGAGLATEAVVTPSGRPAPADAEAFTFLLRPAG